MNGKQKWVVWIYSFCLAIYFAVNALCFALVAALDLPINTPHVALLLGSSIFTAMAISLVGVNTYIAAGVPTDANQ